MVKDDEQQPAVEPDPEATSSPDPADSADAAASIDSVEELTDDAQEASPDSEPAADTEELPADGGTTGEPDELEPIGVAAPAAHEPHHHWFDRLHLTSPFSSRRTLILALVAAVLACALVAGVVVYLLGGFNRNNLEALSPTEVSEQAKAGDCLTWEGAEPRKMARLDCARPHKFEVTANINLANFPGKEFGAGSQFPGSLRFRELRDEHCLSAVTNYLGTKYDLDGKFKIGMIFPGEVDWNKGSRALLCGLQESGQSGAQLAFDGRVADQDQSNIWPVGTCIGINGNVPTDPVGCDQQHAFEVVGIVDLSTEFKAEAPPLDQQDGFIEPKCNEAVEAYLGDAAALRNKTLTMFWANISPTSWLAGTRKVYCSIGKEVDKGGFSRIVGSAKGDIKIDGQAPVPPPAVPDGRTMPSPLPGASPAPIPPPG